MSLSVTTGHPLWKLFQSRVLGPYIIKVLSFGSLDYYGTAYVCFQIVTVAIAGFLSWRLGRKYGSGDQSAMLGLTLFVTCFALLLSPPLLYSWDFIDIIVFLVFVDFVLSDVSLPWFLGLFAIAIWNRDSAVFIALWLIFDPLVRFYYQRQRKLRKHTSLDWGRNPCRHYLYCCWSNNRGIAEAEPPHRRRGAQNFPGQHRRREWLQFWFIAKYRIFEAPVVRPQVLDCRSLLNNGYRAGGEICSSRSATLSGNLFGRTFDAGRLNFVCLAL